jgi:SAM-dependent methyltransferase
MASIDPGVVMAAAVKIMGERKVYAYSVAYRAVGNGGIVDYISSKYRDANARIFDILNAGGLSQAKELAKIFNGVVFFGREFPYDAFTKAKREGLELEYGCLYNIPASDDSADVVIWRNGDPSVTRTEYALKELLRVLKPEGELIVSGVNFAVEDLAAVGITVGDSLPSPIPEGSAIIFTKSVCHGA